MFRLPWFLPIAAALMLSCARALPEDAPGGVAPPAPLPAPNPTPPAGQEGKPPARTFTLRCRFVEGETLSLKLILDAKGTAAAGAAGVVLPLAVALRGDLVQRILRVREDGSAEIGVTLTPTRVRVNNLELPADVPAFPEVVTVLSPTGRLLDVRPAKGNAAAPIPGLDAAGLIGLAQRLSFPEQPVKAGESWTEEGSPGGDQHSRAVTTLLGVSREGGREVARLKQIFALPIKTRPAAPAGGAVEMTGRQAGDLVLRFDIDAGRLVGATGTVDSTLALTGTGTPLTVRLHATVQLALSQSAVISNQ